MFPLKKYRFRVTITGHTGNTVDANVGIGGGFTEVSGFDMTLDTIEYRDGNSPLNTTTKWPGLAKYSNITLKYGATDNMDFYNWVVESSRAGASLNKTNLTIELLDDDGTIVLARWQAERVWPCKYVGTDFNASASEFAFESIELCHEGLTRVS